mmetsp:Transcript_29741/g.61105  ORF Transcript_29741/g.61105 Transcript_29741/m.61105 type:complete len:153 (+) Transcript_29741:92-550(+)|eukprot:CAMPEP_0181306818 /NCGR_PEP_ID=MMETSP1101-20121128/10521_1 /TAXON_ID=46948 /ORGANISM="Rhodomonas abbreviata, Strain Caron Lab Isolate" /LENGTH=152 /DNA_ID=CAMNT_0023412937 /DNA_START=272 /DNA_END=730 /DNA_ORIENTATION=-
MGLFPLFGSKKEEAPAAAPPAVEHQAKSALDIVQSGFGGAPGSKAAISSNDDYDFEDIEETKLRHGIAPRSQKRVVGHSWSEIAIGTAGQCVTLGCFGALMGLSVGAITGPMFAPKGHRFATTIGLMKKQAIWFGVIFGGGGGIVGSIRKYA